MGTTSLVERLAADVTGTFAELVGAHQDDVFTALYRMTGSRSDAEDLAQDVFVRAFRALRTYSSERIEALSLPGWLVTIALNAGRNHFRDAARRPRTTELNGQADRRAAPDAVAHSLETDEWQARLASLGEATRAAVVLRHVVGLSTTETADALGVPEGTVKARVSRGLGQLREQLTSGKASE